MKTYKVMIKDAGDVSKGLGWEKDIFIEGPQGGLYMFARNNKGITKFIGSYGKGFPTMEAIKLAEKA